MSNETEKQTRELTSADLEQVVGADAGRVNVSDISVTKINDGASTSGSGSGGGAGKVQLQDVRFVIIAV